MYINPMHHFAVFTAYVPTLYTCCPHLFLQFFFHPFCISLVICCWNCNMMHVVPVSYPFLVYSSCSACSLPHFCCPFSYTLTELCVFLGFTTSHLLQPSCSSFCQQSFIMPFVVNLSMLFSLFISLFTFIFHLFLPIVLLSLLFMLAIPFLLFIQSMLLVLLLIAILYCSSFGLCQLFIPCFSFTHTYLLASCLSFGLCSGLCSSCHATWPVFVVLLVLFICFTLIFNSC